MISRQINVAAGGDNKHDRLAAERQGQFPPVLTPQPCDGCGEATGGDDFRVARWARYESRGGLVTILAALAGVLFVSSAAVKHATYHWLCRDCQRLARRQRLIAGLLRFFGLFLTIVGLGASAYAAALLLIATSPRGTAEARYWVAPAVAAVLVGLAMLLAARLFRLPGALGRLDRRPFHLEKLFRSHPEKLAELQADYPDLYALGR